MHPIHRIARSGLLVIVVSLASCHTTWTEQWQGAVSYQLAEVAREGEPTEVFEVQVKPGGRGFLNISREGIEAYQDMGVQLTELTRQRAAALEVRPYSGLLVKSVASGSSAFDAGLREGQVLLAVNGKPVFLMKNYEAVVEGLVAGAEVELKLAPDAAGGAKSLRITPERRMRRSREYSVLPFEAAPPRQGPRYVGVCLQSMPAAEVAKVFGDRRHVPLITGVHPGSPAYLAGLRAGDLIRSVDGAPCPDLAGLLALFQKRGARGGRIDLEVGRGGQEIHRARIELADFSGATEVWLPLLFGAEHEARRTSWGLLFGGWLANYENDYVLPAPDRNAVERGSYSLLFGLFSRSWGPAGRHSRLLWFIDF